MLASDPFTSAPTGKTLIDAPDAGTQIIVKRSFFSAAEGETIDYLSESTIVWQQHPAAGSGHVAIDEEVLFPVADGTALTFTTAATEGFVGVRYVIVPTIYDV